MFAAGKTAVVASAANYIEDVFSTYLYTGNGSTQTINNGIDLATKGGLVWYKDRTTAYEHEWVDTARGAGYNLESPNTTASTSRPTALTAFNTTGFTLGSNAAANGSGDKFVSWTFRKQPKFFDVVTLTADGSGNATFSHNLGSTPGCVILKRTDGVSSWYVWHRGLTSTNYSINLNQTGAQADNGFAWITPGSSTVSINGGFLGPSTQWVAYLFAHDAGGFGLTGTDNVISCGSYTGNGSSTGPVIDLGYEPQWLLIKKADSATTNTGWAMFDNMRGLCNSGGVFLYANSSAAEDSSVNIVSALATGFQPVQSGFLTNGNGSTYIYIAIRRGPMKVPTDATTVFTPITSSAGTGTSQTTNFPVDLQVDQYRLGEAPKWVDRLRGVNSPNLTNATPWLVSNATSAEATSSAYTNGWSNTGFLIPSYYNAASTVYWNFRRAPSFFDEVCYTGTGTSQNLNHNLSAVPELMIVKDRGPTANNWAVYSQAVGNTKTLFLDLTLAPITLASVWNNTSPTSTVFTVGINDVANKVNDKFVAYLFATCAGVSKVGSYTGNGSSQTINCGFTSGARFALIKRTDNVGDWCVWDSARGMVSGTDPYLFLNQALAENVYGAFTEAVTTSVGFTVTQNNSGNNINVNGSTYIFLAIA